MPRALSAPSPCPPPASSHTPQLLTQLACPRGSCTSREGECSSWGAQYGSSSLSLVLLGILTLARWSVGPKLFSLTCPSSHFFFPVVSPPLRGKPAWEGMDGGGESPLGAQEDSGPLELGVTQEMWCGLWIGGWTFGLGAALGPWDGWGFPHWPLGISAPSPAFRSAPAPFPLSLDSAGPQPCIPATPLALGGLRWASPIRNFSWERHRGQGFQDFMVNSTIRNGSLCLAQPCHLARVSVGLGCGMSHRSVRAAQVRLLGTPWPHPQHDSTHRPASPGPDSPATVQFLRVGALGEPWGLVRGGRWEEAIL